MLSSKVGCSQSDRSYLLNLRELNKPGKFKDRLIIKPANFNIMQLIACFIFTFILGSFLEYWVYRLMHLSPTFGTKITAHYGHHRSNTNKGFVGYFLDFGLGALLVLPTFLISVPLGIIAVLGIITFAAFASYAHQIQHYNPTKCFWMKMPIHYVHHQNNQWDCNFGLVVDWWDRIFKTYKPVVLINYSTCCR